MSVAEMARHLEVDRDTVTNYEADRTRPRRAVLFVYAAHCHVPLAWLEHGEAPPEPSPVQQSDVTQGERRRRNRRPREDFRCSSPPSERVPAAGRAA